MTDPAENMSFWEHLEALRWHIIRGLLAIVIVSFFAFIAKGFIFDTLLLAPSKPDFFTNRLLGNWADYFDIPALKINKTALAMQNIKLSGQFGVHITVSFVAGLVFSFPYVFYEFWRFISPALHDQERKNARGAVLVVSLLFFIGVLFGYYIIAPLAIDFLGNYNVSEQVKNTINLKSYVGTITSIVLSAGVVFELPVMIYFLVKINLVNASFLKKYRKHAVVLIMILASILTPPDPFSLILVTLPLLLLYEFSIIMAKRVEKKTLKKIKTIVKQ